MWILSLPTQNHILLLQWCRRMNIFVCKRSSKTFSLFVNFLAVVIQIKSDSLSNWSVFSICLISIRIKDTPNYTHTQGIHSLSLLFKVGGLFFKKTPTTTVIFFLMVNSNQVLILITVYKAWVMCAIKCNVAISPLTVTFTPPQHLINCPLFNMPRKLCTVQRAIAWQSRCNY